ncbi:MAG: amino acid-binding protein [Halobacteriales archaeon]
MTDSGALAAYTVRLELADEPGELLRALEPIADHGGNLLSIYHERGDVTPRGRVPVEVDLECPPDRFDDLVAALRDAGIDLVRAGHQRYDESVTVLLSGDLVETDLSGTIDALQDRAGLSVVDFELSAPEGPEGVSSARLRLAVERGGVEAALSAVRQVADRKDLQVVEPLGARAGTPRADGGTDVGDRAESSRGGDRPGGDRR